MTRHRSLIVKAHLRVVGMARAHLQPLRVQTTKGFLRFWRTSGKKGFKLLAYAREVGVNRVWLDEV